MKNKFYFFYLFLSFFYSPVFSQELYEELAKVEFADGTIKKAKLNIFQLEGKSGNDKIKICNEFKNDCKKYQLSDIKLITFFPSKMIIEKYKISADKEELFSEKYKVLYSKKKRKPLMATVLYTGENYSFYRFNTTKVTNKFNHAQIIITKSDSDIVDYWFAQTNAKTDLKKLSKYFKECNIFIEEANKKKAHKKNENLFFYKLTDECDNLE